jgi:hypothetical protein
MPGGSRANTGLVMVPEIDIWRTALAMLKRYGDDAMLEACTRADHALEDGDWQGSLTWHRIIDALERLMAKAPAEDEATH